MTTWKPKPWHGTFEVRVVRRETGTWSGIRFSYAIFYKGTDERPNDRYYSSEDGARRGAAQIYNSIEKVLLGK